MRLGERIRGEPFAAGELRKIAPLLTTAAPTADGRFYVLNGTKQFITNAGFADLFTVFAKVVKSPGAEGKFSAFLVERSTPGVSTGPEEHKLGIKGSSTRQVILDDIKGPSSRTSGSASSTSRSSPTW